MIDFNADILSGRALGNVFLGENISKYIIILLNLLVINV